MGGRGMKRRRGEEEEMMREYFANFERFYSRGPNWLIGRDLRDH